MDPNNPFSSLETIPAFIYEVLDTLQLVPVLVGGLMGVIVLGLLFALFDGVTARRGE